MRVGWVEEVIREGEGFLEGQTCYKELGRNLRVFDGLFRDKTKSTLITNQLKYNIRKFCETLAEVREIAGYGSDLPAYKVTADMLTRVSKCIYLESDFAYKILRVLQYATVMGIGYLWPKVRAIMDMASAGWSSMTSACSMSFLSGSPSRMTQDAYAVTIYDYMPIAEAHGRFPLFQGLASDWSDAGTIRANCQASWTMPRRSDMEIKAVRSENLYTLRSTLRP